MQFIKGHLLAIGVYVVYMLLWICDFTQEVQFEVLEKNLRPGQRLPLKEWGPPSIFFGIIFALIVAANAVGRSRDQTPFYLIMLVLILVPLIILCKY